MAELVFVTDLPPASHFSEHTLVIYDRKLLTPTLRAWLKTMPASLGVHAGEKLKDLQAFPRHMTEILKRTSQFSPNKLCIVTLGGGSVGDFGGFVASVLKRGVKLVHIPSTWLAAIDSAHGGKTALNVGGMKNQIGTFYPASSVILVRSVLMAQPEARAHEALGELVKMAFLTNAKWSYSLSHKSLPAHELMWTFLKPAIRAKYAVVNRDPFEKKGIRQLLNLGHTFGHVLEATRGAAHGEAVAQGLYFSLKWSLQLGLLSVKEYLRCLDLLKRVGLVCWLDGKFKPLPMAKAEALLLHDKKRSSRDQINFIFIKKWGKPVNEKVSIASILKEAKRQGWAR